MHSPDTLRIYAQSLDGTVLLMVRDWYGIAPGMSMAQTTKILWPAVFAGTVQCGTDTEDTG